MSTERVIQSGVESSSSNVDRVPVKNFTSFRNFLWKSCRIISHQFRKMGYQHQAIKWCMRAINLVPENGKSYCELGHLYLMNREFDDAQTWFDEAQFAESPPQQEWVHFNNGCVLEALGLWPLAFQEYKSAFEINPTYARAELAYVRLSASLN